MVPGTNTYLAKVTIRSLFKDRPFAQNRSDFEVPILSFTVCVAWATIFIRPRKNGSSGEDQKSPFFQKIVNILRYLLFLMRKRLYLSNIGMCDNI